MIDLKANLFCFRDTDIKTSFQTAIFNCHLNNKFHQRQETVKNQTLPAKEALSGLCPQLSATGGEILLSTAWFMQLIYAVFQLLFV